MSEEGKTKTEGKETERSGMGFSKDLWCITELKKTTALQVLSRGRFYATMQFILQLPKQRKHSFEEVVCVL